MPVSRPRRLVQKVAAACRLFVAWCVCIAYGLFFMVALPLCGSTRLWLALRTPWARHVLRVLGVQLQVRGQEHLRGPAIFIANHMSLIDVVILPALVPKTCRLVAKRAVLWFPIIGWAFARGGALLIDRSKPQEAAQKLVDGLRQLPPNWSLVIFPEGTRSRTGALQRFKRGAFTLATASRLPIVPVALAGTHDIIGPGGLLFYPGTVTVQVGAPIETHAWRDDTLREHIATCHAAMTVCLQALTDTAAEANVATAARLG